MLIIDEPELHLHRLIQRRLWDSIQQERGDCLFVYSTHDVDFAVSRAAATQVALQRFDGQLWEWTLVPSEAALPEDVLLSILGSRKPVLFTEGDESSLDAEIYSHVYSDYEIVPVGSCSNVIHSTVSFQKHAEMHRVDSKGIVDLDQRTPNECAYLAERGIYTTGVSEVENLLLLKPVLSCVANILHYDDLDNIIEQVASEVLEYLKRDQQRVVIAMLNGYLEERPGKMRGGGKTEVEIASELSRLSADIQIKAHEFRGKLEQIIATNDYEELSR